MGTMQSFYIFISSIKTYRMPDFKSLKIKNKLRILSLLSILSILVLGFISNNFFSTSKVLAMIIDAERVHNNTFQEGIEDFYKFRISKDPQWLDSSVVKIERANQMARNFGQIDQLLQLPKEEYIEILFQTYQEAYNHDRSNANLMANRLRRFLWVKIDKLAEAQQVAMSGYHLGEKIKQEILTYKNDSTFASANILDADLQKMKFFYHDFAVNISSLNTLFNRLLFRGIIVLSLLLIISIAFISTLITRSIAHPVQEMVDKFRIIATGNLNTPINIDTSNEIGDLARSFREIQNGARSD